jgi:hypothetical protein
MTRVVVAIMWLYYICWVLPRWVMGRCKPRPPSMLMWRLAYWVAEREAGYESGTVRPS